MIPPFQPSFKKESSSILPKSKTIRTVFILKAYFNIWFRLMLKPLGVIIRIITSSNRIKIACSKPILRWYHRFQKYRLLQRHQDIRRRGWRSKEMKITAARLICNSVALQWALNSFRVLIESKIIMCLVCQWRISKVHKKKKIQWFQVYESAMKLEQLWCKSYKVQNKKLWILIWCKNNEF